MEPLGIVAIVTLLGNSVPAFVIAGNIARNSDNKTITQTPSIFLFVFFAIIFNLLFLKTTCLRTQTFATKSEGHNLGIIAFGQFSVLFYSPKNIFLSAFQWFPFSVQLSYSSKIATALHQPALAAKTFIGRTDTLKP
jgi:ABC-type Na+ efflux pump permease subunit